VAGAVSGPTAVCRSCGAELFYAVTAGGKRIPLDAEPHPEGNIAVTRLKDRTQAQTLSGTELHLARSMGNVLYRTHFATCPDHALWRRR
jgi:hypothetical protein